MNGDLRARICWRTLNGAIYRGDWSLNLRHLWALVDHVYTDHGQAYCWVEMERVPPV